MSVGGAPTELIYVFGIEPREIVDRGDGDLVPITQAGYVELATAGVETRTLGDPTFRGQTIDLVFVTDGGNCVVTTASPVNQAGNNTLTFADIGDHVRLVGFNNPTDGWEWRVVANDGVALTTV